MDDLGFMSLSKASLKRPSHVRAELLFPKRGFLGKPSNVGHLGRKGLAHGFVNLDIDNAEIIPFLLRAVSCLRRKE